MTCARSVSVQVLRSSSPTEVVPFIAEFLTPKRAGAPVPLQAVMRDQFGNYVIQVCGAPSNLLPCFSSFCQCIIDISQGDQREAIAAFVMSEKEEVQVLMFSYGFSSLTLCISSRSTPTASTSWHISRRPCLTAAGCSSLFPSLRTHSQLLNPVAAPLWEQSKS